MGQKTKNTGEIQTFSLLVACTKLTVIDVAGLQIL